MILSFWRRKSMGNDLLVSHYVFDVLSEQGQWIEFNRAAIVLNTCCFIGIVELKFEPTNDFSRWYSLTAEEKKLSPQIFHLSKSRKMLMPFVFFVLLFCFAFRRIFRHCFVSLDWAECWFLYYRFLWRIFIFFVEANKQTL